jgi:transposase-like protein
MFSVHSKPNDPNRIVDSQNRRQSERWDQNSAYGISTRSVDDLVKAMGMSGISKSQVSRLCAEIDDKVKAFLHRPIEGDWPYLWIDATYVKVRSNGRIVSVAVTVAVGVNADGRREILGMMSAPRKPSRSGPRSCASSPGAVCAASSW